MIFRVLVFTLLFSINAYAKPVHHSTPHQDKSSQSQTNSQASEDDLTKQLTSHNWQITQITKQPKINLDEDSWIFNFASNGKYKGFGNCNYLSGSFKTDNAGAFRISNLDGSNNHCDDVKDDEPMVFNMLLLADSFEMNGDGLLLKSNGQVLIGLKTTDKEVTRSVAHKTKGDKSAGKSAHKKTDKKSGKKSASSKAKSSSKSDQKSHAKTDAKKPASKAHDKKKQSLH